MSETALWFAIGTVFTALASLFAYSCGALAGRAFYRRIMEEHWAFSNNLLKEAHASSLEYGDALTRHFNRYLVSLGHPPAYPEKSKPEPLDGVH